MTLQQLKPLVPNHPIFYSKAFYFCFYGGLATLMPFLALYYEQIGMTGQQIGIITGVSPLVTMISASVWSGFADATRQYRLTMTVALVGVMGAVLLLSTVTAFVWLIVAVILLGLCMSPVMPMIDNTTLDLLGDQADRYGKVRLWGAIGFGIAPPIVGYFIDQVGLGLAFSICIVMLILCLFISRRLPIDAVENLKQGDAPPFWRSFRTLIRNRAWGLFLGVIFIVGMSAAVINNYLFLYMNHIGASQTLMGIALTVAMFGEIAIFFLSERLLRRWQTHQLLMIALIGHAVRLLAYSYVSIPLLVLPFQLLHGFSFALIWVAAVRYAKQLAPTGMGVTAQGILTGVKFGLASAIGTFIGGVLYQQLGPFILFRWAGISVVVGIGLLLFAASPTAVPQPSET